MQPAIIQCCLSVVDQWPARVTRRQEAIEALKAIAIFALTLYSTQISLSAKLIVTGVAAGATLFLFFFSRLHPGTKEANLIADIVEPKDRIKKLDRPASSQIGFSHLWNLAVEKGTAFMGVPDCTAESLIKDNNIGGKLGSNFIGYGTDSNNKSFVILRVYRGKETYGSFTPFPIYEVFYGEPSGRAAQAVGSLLSFLFKASQETMNGWVDKDVSCKHESYSNIFGENATLEEVHSAFQQLIDKGVFKREIGEPNFFNRRRVVTYFTNRPA